MTKSKVSNPSEWAAPRASIRAVASANVEIVKGVAAIAHLIPTHPQRVVRRLNLAGTPALALEIKLRRVALM